MTRPRATRTFEPIDRLTRLCSVMVDALEEHPEYGEDVRALVMLNADERGGIVQHGYDEEEAPIVDLFLHLQAMFQAQGKTLAIVPIGGEG